MRTPIVLQNRKISLVIIHKGSVEMYDNQTGYSRYTYEGHAFDEADKYLMNGWKNVHAKEYEV